MAHRPNSHPGSNAWPVWALSVAVIASSANSVLVAQTGRRWWAAGPSLEQTAAALAAGLGLLVASRLALTARASRRRGLRRETLVLGIACLLAAVPVVPASSTAPGFDLPPEDITGHSSIPPRATTHIVDRGDSLWSISAEHVTRVVGGTPTTEELGPYWRSVVTVNLPRLRSGDADLIYPGEQVVLPADGDVR